MISEFRLSAGGQADTNLVATESEKQRMNYFFYTDFLWQSPSCQASHVWLSIRLSYYLYYLKVERKDDRRQTKLIYTANGLEVSEDFIHCEHLQIKLLFFWKG